VALETTRCDIPEESKYPSDPTPRALTACETATLLGVSESWVRRHRNELPLLRVGRLIRFDSFLLLQLTQARMQSGKSLRPERNSMLFRYQRGYVYLTGKKVKVWYGMFREDVRTPEGQVRRRQRHVRLGTRGELPTRSAARSRLAELFRSSTPTTEMNFRELVERWQKAVGRQ